MDYAMAASPTRVGMLAFGFLPFLVLDKVKARLFAFDEGGKLIRATPVLLGTGIGDKFAPGVVEMDMFKTKPWQRITQAGRFLAERGRNLQGEQVLWVDYDSGIATRS